MYRVMFHGVYSYSLLWLAGCGDEGGGVGMSGRGDQHRSAIRGSAQRLSFDDGLDQFCFGTIGWVGRLSGSCFWALCVQSWVWMEAKIMGDRESSLSASGVRGQSALSSDGETISLLGGASSGNAIAGINEDRRFRCLGWDRVRAARW